MLPRLAQSLTSPTPIASLISSLAALVVLGLLYLIVQWLRGERSPNEVTFFDRLIELVRRADRAIVHAGLWITGTRYQNPNVRHVVTVTVFTGIAVAGALLPWPWGLVILAIGMLAIWVVFHWSRDEDETLADLRFEEKDIKIRGDLSLEVVVACAFILVFAPIAFAQIADAGLGFQIKPEAQPFAFLAYTLIELVKAGSLVDYYDLFSNQLPFDRMSEVQQGGMWAKGAVLMYRLSITILLLAALKRLADIARRRAEGLDLRNMEEMLRTKDPKSQKEAVEQLKTFALKGRGNAELLLERILTPAKSDDWSFGTEARFAAANALVDYADRRGGTGALYTAADAYRKIVRDDWTREKHAEAWAMGQYNLGNALRELGRREVSTARLHDAVTAITPRWRSTHAPTCRPTGP